MTTSATALASETKPQIKKKMVKEITGEWVGNNLKWMIPMILAAGWIFVLNDDVRDLEEDVKDLRAHVPNSEVIQLQLRQMNEKLQKMETNLDKLALSHKHSSTAALVKKPMAKTKPAWIGTVGHTWIDTQRIINEVLTKETN